MAKPSWLNGLRSLPSLLLFRLFGQSLYRPCLDFFQLFGSGPLLCSSPDTLDIEKSA